MRLLRTSTHLLCVPNALTHGPIEREEEGRKEGGEGGQGVCEIAKSPRGLHPHRQAGVVQAVQHGRVAVQHKATVLQ